MRRRLAEVARDLVAFAEIGEGDEGVGHRDREPASRRRPRPTPAPARSGIDPSIGMLEVGRRERPSIPFVAADSDRPPVPRRRVRRRDRQLRAVAFPPLRDRAVRHDARPEARRPGGAHLVVRREGRSPGDVGRDVESSGPPRDARAGVGRRRAVAREVRRPPGGRAEP